VSSPGGATPLRPESKSKAHLVVQGFHTIQVSAEVNDDPEGRAALIAFLKSAIATVEKRNTGES
jgi:hypothetical protein